MGHIDFKVTETVQRLGGRIQSVTYTYEEVRTHEQPDASTLRNSTSKKSRIYEATASRSDYESAMQQSLLTGHALPYEQFVVVLRPIMMSTYNGNELRDAFALLDRDGSGSIDLSELVAFLAYVHPNLTTENFRLSVCQTDSNLDYTISFIEFSDMVLRGIARDLITNQPICTKTKEPM